MIINMLPETFRTFFNFFFYGTPYNTASIFAYNYILIMITIAVFLCYCIFSIKEAGRVAIISLSLVLFPLGLNAIYVVSFGTMHQLMTFAYNLFYVLPLVGINMLKRTAVEGNIKQRIERVTSLLSLIVICIIALIGFHNVFYSNGAYVYKKLVYDNTALHAQSIWKDIHEIEGYEDGVTEVVIIGRFDESNASYKSEVGAKYEGFLVGALGSAMTYYETPQRFFYAVLGRGTILTQYEQGEYDVKEYADMPQYPYKGYCKMIDNRVVVKLSE